MAGKVLMKIFSVGLTNATRDDLEEILIATRVLRLSENQMALAEVRLLISLQDWIGAVRVLKQMETFPGLDRSLTISLLAGCLFKLKDPEWCRFATELLQDGRNEAAQALLAQFLTVAVEPARPAREARLPSHARDHIAYTLREATPFRATGS